MRYIIAVAAIVLAGCSQTPQEPTFKTTVTGIANTGVLLSSWEETTPIVWKGQLLFVHSTKLDGVGGNIEVIDESKNILGVGPDNFGFVSAIVHNNRLYVFGVTAWGSSWKEKNSIRVTYTEDLVTWSEPFVIKTAIEGQTFFNTSITPSDNGFVMAYEVCENNIQCFSFRFSQSQDLVNWADIGRIYSNRYSACPTIRYYDGYYYVFYLYNGEKQYFTVAARSRDFSRWEISPQAVLTPWVHAPGAINTSDFDFVEFNGRLEMVYIDGNQTTTGITRRAVFEGTQAEFFDLLF